MHNEQFADWEVQTFKFIHSDRIYRFRKIGNGYFFDASYQVLSETEMNDIGYTKA